MLVKLLALEYKQRRVQNVLAIQRVLLSASATTISVDMFSLAGHYFLVVPCQQQQHVSHQPRHRWYQSHGFLSIREILPLPSLLQLLPLVQVSDLLLVSYFIMQQDCFSFDCKAFREKVVTSLASRLFTTRVGRKPVNS